MVRNGDQGLQVLIIHKRQPPEWRLPKGRIEEGETPERAAVREVAEETGLTCEVMKELGQTEHYFPEKASGKQRCKRTTYYLMRQSGPPSPPREDTFDVIEWVSPDEAAAHLTFDTEREMVKKAVEALGHEASGYLSAARLRPRGR